MFIKAVYDTNEVLGSFWRPHDYMDHVPTAKVTGSNTLAMSEDAVSVSLSEQGVSLASKMSTSVNPIDISADNNDKDTVKRYIYNGIEGTVALMDVAV